MEEGTVLTLTRPYLPPPKLVVPLRNPNGGFVHGGLNSPTPTPMTFFSSLFADQDSCIGSKLLPHLLAEGLGSPDFSPTAFYDNISRDGMSMSACNTSNETLESSELDFKKPTPCGLHSTRSAAYKAMMPSRLPLAPTSKHFTVSPGISPASFLESPILFNTQQVDLSPTTGTLSSQDNALGGQSLISLSRGKDDINKGDDSFIFKPHLIAAECGSPMNISIGTNGHTQAQEYKEVCCSQLLLPDSRQELSSDIESGVMEPQDCFELEPTISLGMKPPGVSVNTNARQSIDGYNWKKYGQKQLKNSENSRSYYKCSHPFCPAKRQVGRLQEGEITEIMYKGDHSHPKPQGTRRGARSINLLVNDLEGNHQNTFDQNLLVTQKKMVHGKALGDSSLTELRQDGLYGTPETSNDKNAFCEASIACENVDNEYDFKRRRIENEQEKPFRTIREPRVVVQTVSDLDVLDDGYRWRKYGQKVVKGQCYPRNYYKCTNYGCGVKKHVERSFSDVTSVITTYEGKHNHGVPAARGASGTAC